MSGNIAIVRKHIQRIDGVTRTWFEWCAGPSEEALLKTLVVEVEFDTDPNSSDCRKNVLEAIFDTAKGVLKNETTMAVSNLRIVPKTS